MARTFPKFELFTLPFGLAKCGVLLTLNASARNCSLTCRLIENVRKRLASIFTTPGPRIVLRPTLPNRTSVTRANAVVSKNVPSSPTWPNSSTVGLI